MHESPKQPKITAQNLALERKNMGIGINPKSRSQPDVTLVGCSLKMIGVRNSNTPPNKRRQTPATTLLKGILRLCFLYT